MDFKSIVEEELSRYSIFRDESKLSLDYIPPILLHREEELRSLTGFFRSIIDQPSKTSPRVIIRGPMGTGKTVLSKRFGEDFEKFARRKGMNFNYIHVNCREEGSFFNILKNIIAKYYEKAFPQRGFSSKELLEILIEILDKRRSDVLIALDELEALIRKEGADPLFSLTRLNENRPPNAPQHVSLLCIFREPECQKVLPLLDSSTQSTLGHNTLHLEKYDGSHLRDILNYRIQEAFKADAVASESVELIADLAEPHGDARFAIELLHLSGKCAEAERTSKVLTEHVRKAEMHVHPSLNLEELRHLTFHEKLFLQALARCLKESKAAYAVFGEAEAEYTVLCESYREKPRMHTQLWKYVKYFADAGMISTKSSGKGQRGKTTLMGLYVSADRLEKELDKMIEVKMRGRR